MFILNTFPLKMSEYRCECDGRKKRKGHVGGTKVCVSVYSNGNEIKIGL